MSEQTGSWQPDPFGRNQYRYWDGTQWTDQVSNNGVVTTDPAVAAPEAPAEPPAAEPQAPAAADPTGWAASSEPAPTQAVPAADPTTVSTPSYAAPSAPGAPGGPGSYPPPAAGGTGGGAGGNKTPLIIAGAGVLALILGIGAYFLFFSGDDDEASGAKADIIESLTDEGLTGEGLSRADAECVANELDKSLDLDDLARAIANDDDPTAAQLAAIFAAFETCDVDLTAMGDDDPDDADDTTTTTTPEDDDDDGGSSSGGVTMPPAMIAAIASEMASEMGITQDQAECFVEGLFENMDDGQFEEMLTDPDNMDFEGMEWALDLFSDCGIDPEAVAGSGGFQSGTGGNYGDDPELDALWDACADGDGQACDDLWYASPGGSQYEEFGDTCGGRFPPGSVFCADEM